MRSATPLNLRPIAGALLIILFAVGLMAAMASVFRAEAATFNPVGSACLDDENTVDPNLFSPGSPNECDGNNAPGANSSITTSFGVPAGDSNFGGVVAFTPPEWGVARDADIEDARFAPQLTGRAGPAQRPVRDRAPCLLRPARGHD